MADRRARFGEQGTMLLDLLESAATEQEIHEFLELNPVFIPGLLDLHGGPLGRVVVSKLPLGSEYITDFAFISRDSQSRQFTFVEIEHPKKRIFTKDDAFTKDLNDALQQVRDWLRWFEQNKNYIIEVFRVAFPILDATLVGKPIYLRVVLVYGRRTELNSPKRHQRWESLPTGILQSRPLNVMTYDRLVPDRKWGLTLPHIEGLHTCRYRNGSLVPIGR